MSNTESLPADDPGGQTPQYKAIETVHNGRRFRSRLEARWAVFFEHLGIDFMYEPEGFEFYENERYLPDFFLPQVHMWAEVKPIEFSDRELGLAAKLANATGRPVLLLIGQPDVQPYEAYHPVDEETGDYYRCHYLIDPFWNHGRGEKYYKDEHRFYGCPEGWEMEQISDNYRQAVHMARGARFGGGGRW